MHKEPTIGIAGASQAPQQSIDRLIAQSYDELARLAHARIWSANKRNVVATESLLHECFLRMSALKNLKIEDRKQFFGYASKVMRTIIVDSVREANAQRRGSGQADLTLHTELAGVCEKGEDVEAIHDALKDLERVSPELAQLVEMRFFGGMTEIEIAEALGVSERTVRREWEKARAALVVLLEE